MKEEQHFDVTETRQTKQRFIRKTLDQRNGRPLSTPIVVLRVWPNRRYLANGLYDMISWHRVSP